MTVVVAPEFYRHRPLRRSQRWRVVGALTVLLVAACIACDPAPTTPHDCRHPRRGLCATTTTRPATEVVTVHIDQPAGDAVTDLAGVTWNGGDLELLAPFYPPSVRFGARLDDVSHAPGQLDLGDLIAKGKRVRAMGGVPVVTLSQMPAWLARTPPPGCRETRRGVPCSTSAMGPTDLATWQTLVHDVVVGLATSDAAITDFEVWNEPNNTRSWADTDRAFIDMAMASHRGVASAATETGLDLVLGGPATGEVSDLIGAYAAAAQSQGTPPGFLSWHHYTRDPLDYGRDAARLRQMVATGRLVVSEWNHYGRKNDDRVGAVGAAFALASLIEMEDAGVDRANIYRGVAVGTGPEAAGLITGDGVKRSSWWVLDAWSDLSGHRVAVDGSDPAAGLWVRATRSGDRVDLLVASYADKTTVDHGVDVILGGCVATTAIIRRIDPKSPSFTAAKTVPLAGLHLDITSPAALWVTATCPSH